MANYLSAPNLLLPWSSSSEDDKKLGKIIAILSIPFLVFAVAIPMVQLPEIDREELDKKVQEFTEVVLEEQTLPTPAPTPIPTPEPEEVKPEEIEPEEPQPEEEEAPKIEPEVVVEPEPAQLIDEAREVAEAEINQFADTLSELRDSFDLSDVTDDLTQSTGEAEEFDRSIIAADVEQTSGGIDTSQLSRDTGGVALSGKTSTKVASKLASSSSTAARATGGEGAAKPREKSYRSQEDVRKIMDANQGAIYGIYQRELRKDPTLEGKVRFRIVIEPNGSVSNVEVVSSDLNNPSLERKLANRIRLINFGAKDVLQTTLEYDIDFLPF